jgi:hypothetical protein
MFCPKCGSKQGERRFCTSCGTNLAAVSQALQTPFAGQIPGPVTSGSHYLAQPGFNPMLTPYEMERQREYAKGMKMLVLGGAFLGFNILKVLFSFGHANFGFWGVLSLILFAVGLSKVLSWRNVAGVATHSVLAAVPPAIPEQTPVPAPTPNTAQLQRPHPGPPPIPQPVFSALQPATQTNEIEPARSTTHAATNQHGLPRIIPSVTEDDTRRLPDQQVRPQAEQPAGPQANWKME